MKLLYHFVGYCFAVQLFFSCTKQIDYQPQLSAMQSSINAMQKRTDSLSTALALANANSSVIGKQIDSVKSALSKISDSISTLTNQLNAQGANIIFIKSQIDTLTANYNSLLGILGKILAQLDAEPGTLKLGCVWACDFSIQSKWHGNISIISDKYGSANNLRSFGPNVGIDDGSGLRAKPTYCEDSHGIANEACRLNNPNQLFFMQQAFTTNHFFMNGGDVVDQMGYFCRFRLAANDNRSIKKALFSAGFENSIHFAIYVDKDDKILIRYSTNQKIPSYDMYALYEIKASTSNIPSTDALNNINKKNWNNLFINYEYNSLVMYLNGIKTSLPMIWSTNMPSINPVPFQNYAYSGDTGFSECIRIGHEASNFGEFKLLSIFDGDIDEMRFYNRPLSTAEIQYLSTH